MTRRSTGWGTSRSVRQGWEFKRPPRVSFFHYSLPFLEDSLSSRLQRPVWAIPWTDFKLWSDFLRDFEARVSSLDGFGLRIWTGSSLFAHHLLVLLLSHAPRAYSGQSSLFACSLQFSELISICGFWMAPQKETGTSRTQGQRPAEPPQ